MSLTLARTRPNEFPVKWDDRPVEWNTEDPMPGRALSHFDFTCNGCGASDAPVDCYVGRVDPAPGATFEVDRERKLPSGRTYVRTVDVPAWPLARLSLYRCLACGHDEVYDHETEQLWDLDDSDYGDAGSVDPEKVQGALF